MKTKLLSISFLLYILSSCSVPPPEPYGVLPSQKQIEWQQMEYYMFIHFGMNTFTDKEWGDGGENPEFFNPTALDCRQWAATAKAAGMKGIIITAKHHDGFCLWPSKYSTHTVRESPWKEGKGDILKELSEACKEYDLKFGVYLSPWDRNHPDYGTPAYNEIFANTLTEVLTSYGDVFEQWFDGANGEGPNGKKQEYDWPLFHKTVYEHQPHALIFSDIGPDCRWMGNERGVAAETNWSRLNIEGFGPGVNAPPRDTLQQGNIYGTHWVPAETDVSIRPGWFYSDATNERVKSLDQLIDIYYTSIGRNSNLLLNIPPDRSGKIYPTDSMRLMELRQAIDNIFANDLALQANITATNGRGGRYTAAQINDEKYDTYWAAKEDHTQTEIELSWEEAQTINHVVLQEYIPLGQRVQHFTISYLQDDEWASCAEGTTIGYKRIMQFPTVQTTKLRIHIDASLACPVINNLSVYYAPERHPIPAISRTKEGLVSMQFQQPGYRIHYTTDFSDPNEQSPLYEKAFKAEGPLKIKAIAIHENGNTSKIALAEYDLASTKWRVVSPIGNAYDKIIDGDEKQVITLPADEPIRIDLGETLLLKGFSYTPDRQAKANNIYQYSFAVSEDGESWNTIIENASFDNIENNPVKQRIFFREIQKARFIELKTNSPVNEDTKYQISEIGIILNQDKE